MHTWQNISSYGTSGARPTRTKTWPQSSICKSLESRAACMHSVSIRQRLYAFTTFHCFSFFSLLEGQLVSPNASSSSTMHWRQKVEVHATNYRFVSSKNEHIVTNTYLSHCKTILYTNLCLYLNNYRGKNIFQNPKNGSVIFFQIFTLYLLRAF